MDKLKKEIEERKRKIAEEKAAIGSKYAKRGDIEKAKEPEPKPVEPPKPVAKPKEEAKPVPAPEPAPVERQPTLPTQEVKNRLRARREPVTLFGETDVQREDRLKALEIADPSGEHTGQENEFGATLEKLEKESDAESKATQKEPEWKIVLTDESPQEDWIICKFQGWIREWEEELDGRSEVMKRTAQGKMALATFIQTKQYLQPFYKALHERTVPQDVVAAVYEIGQLLEQREFLKANDVYLRLAIGNAAWPMGVTMVGIHERSGREKIFSNKVAHIMNDETQRKYIQSVKRVITFVQKNHPNDPSKNMG